MKLKILFGIMVSLSCLYSGTSFSKTNRSATVTIMNVTGGPIVAGFSHKYSNVFHDSGSTSKTKPLGTTPLDNMQKVGTARFRTGFLTTGRDWWIVSYVDDKGCSYISSPRNARKFVDGLEKTAIFTGGILIDGGVDIAIGGLLDPEPVGKVAGGVVGLVTAGLGGTMVGLSNSESTAGFKRHFLRKKDTSVLILLAKDEVTFVSKSGKSSTRMVATGKCIAKKK